MKRRNLLRQLLPFLIAHCSIGLFAANANAQSGDVAGPTAAARGLCLEHVAYPDT